MKKLFDVPDSYKEHITKFDSSDGFLALGIIVTYFVVMTISGIIVRRLFYLDRNTFYKAAEHKHRKSCTESKVY